MADTSRTSQHTTQKESHDRRAKEDAPDLRDEERAARDVTGVDPQESITRDDPSNRAFHDKVPEAPQD